MAEGTVKTPMLDRAPQRMPSKSYASSSQFSGNSRLSRSVRSSVVIDQPRVVTEKMYHSSAMNDHYIGLSIVLCILTIAFGCFWTLVFSIPAIVFSVKAAKMFRKQNYREMLEYEKIAFAFNIGVIVCWIVSLTIVIGIAYRELCGPTGVKCNTSPHKYPKV